MKQKEWQKLQKFLAGIGIEAREGTAANGFIPGVRIEEGVLLVDLDECMPGDLLHEAGHIAVVPRMFREGLTGDLEDCPAVEEMMGYMEAHPEAFDSPEDPIARGILQAGENEATAWSYAAAVHLGYSGDILIERPDAFVTYTDGRISVDEDSGEITVLQLEMKAHLGIHGLRAAGMVSSVRSFPNMTRWTQI